METPTSSPEGSSARRRRGRPTTYSPELADLILDLVRHKGLAPTAAAEEAGVARGTLSRWRYEYPNLDSRLAVARLEYRTVRLGIIRSATTKDGRPDWRAAAWELEHAFPEDYSMNPKRRAAFRTARQAEVQAFERESATWRAAEHPNTPAPKSSEIPQRAFVSLPEPTPATSEVPRFTAAPSAPRLNLPVLLSHSEEFQNSPALSFAA